MALNTSSSPPDVVSKSNSCPWRTRRAYATASRALEPPADFRPAGASDAADLSFFFLGCFLFPFATASAPPPLSSSASSAAPAEAIRSAAATRASCAPSASSLSSSLSPSSPLSSSSSRMSRRRPKNRCIAFRAAACFPIATTLSRLTPVAPTRAPVKDKNLSMHSRCRVVSKGRRGRSSRKRASAPVWSSSEMRAASTTFQSTAGSE
mmetsp:Transcript_10656/g.29913  ORF Transcript_10656/g.29913 Transcript_10656/m.29913 type:complete len:208 (-) Transcript_10656:1230-1853(-)